MNNRKMSRFFNANEFQSSLNLNDGNQTPNLILRDSKNLKPPHQTDFDTIKPSTHPNRRASTIINMLEE